MNSAKSTRTRHIALEDGIAYVPAPHGQALALARTCVVKHRLGRSRRVVVNSPRDQRGEHPVTPCDRLPDNLAVVRSTGNDGDSPFERVQFTDAALPADANHLVAPVKRVLQHVDAELTRGADNANFHFLCTNRTSTTNNTMLSVPSTKKTTFFCWAGGM